MYRPIQRVLLRWFLNNNKRIRSKNLNKKYLLQTLLLIQWLLWELFLHRLILKRIQQFQNLTFHLTILVLNQTLLNLRYLSSSCINNQTLSRLLQYHLLPTPTRTDLRQLWSTEENLWSSALPRATKMRMTLKESLGVSHRSEEICGHLKTNSPLCQRWSLRSRCWQRSTWWRKMAAKKKRKLPKKSYLNPSYNYLLHSCLPIWSLLSLNQLNYQ